MGGAPEVKEFICPAIYTSYFDNQHWMCPLFLLSPVVFVHLFSLHRLTYGMLFYSAHILADYDPSMPSVANLRN